MRSRRGFPLLATAVLAALVVAGTAACRRPPTNPPGSTTTTTTTRASTTTTTTTPGIDVQTRKIRYGPFTVPNINKPGVSPFAAAMPALGATLENGMIWNQPVTNVEKPCDDCFITAIQAGLEYTDGANANINNGMWLHHMVGMAAGSGKFDATCQNSRFSLPHFAVGGTGANTERFFASGNERTGIDMLQMQSGRFGYRVNPGDRFSLLVDLMNLNTTDQTVYLTLDYKYVAATTPGFRPAKPVWLDAAQCGTSEVPAKTGKYTVNAPTWTSTISGTLLGGAGHLHDGGTNSVFEKNGTQYCDSVASYGTKPEFVDPGGMDHGGGGMDHGHGGAHISEMTLCPAGSTLAPGDKLDLKGNYDDALHPQMVHDGKLHSVMSIGILYYGQ